MEIMRPGVSCNGHLEDGTNVHNFVLKMLAPEEDVKILTADEVIQEIDDMMNEHSLEEYIIDTQDSSCSETSVNVTPTVPTISTYTVDNMQHMCLAALRELICETDATTLMMSRVLVSELALREELEFDKELKSHFISQLVTVQKKRRSDCKKSKGKDYMTKKDSKGRHATAIPYYPCQGPPTSEQLQIYINILQAIIEDSSSVPKMLVDYILRVLCPT